MSDAEQEVEQVLDRAQDPIGYEALSELQLACQEDGLTKVDAGYPQRLARLREIFGETYVNGAGSR